MLREPNQLRSITRNANQNTFNEPQLFKAETPQRVINNVERC